MNECEKCGKSDNVRKVVVHVNPVQEASVEKSDVYKPKFETRFWCDPCIEERKVEGVK